MNAVAPEMVAKMSRKPAKTKSPREILAAMSADGLYQVAKEIQAWKNGRELKGRHLNMLARRLQSDCGFEEEGVYQVAEALVMDEVLQRWMAAHLAAPPALLQRTIALDGATEQDTHVCFDNSTGVRAWIEHRAGRNGRGTVAARICAPELKDATVDEAGEVVSTLAAATAAVESILRAEGRGDGS